MVVHFISGIGNTREKSYTTCRPLLVLVLTLLWIQQNQTCDSSEMMQAEGSPLRPCPELHLTVSDIPADRAWLVKYSSKLLRNPFTQRSVLIVCGLDSKWLQMSAGIKKFDNGRDERHNSYYRAKLSVSVKKRISTDASAFEGVCGNSKQCTPINGETSQKVL